MATTLGPVSQAGDDLESPNRLIVVRHGATDWSVAGRHTGRTDVPLNDAGVEDARALRSRLGQYHPAVVFASPLRRARDTCRLAGFGEVALVDDRLVEWDYGDYEGLTFAEIRARRPGWKLFDDGAAGGESSSQVGDRADSFLDSLRSDERLEGQEALVFAHGHLLRVLAARWLRLPPSQARLFELDASGIGVLGWKRSEPVIEHWNL